VRVLVTGGAGFIGSNLVRGCLEGGYEVRILDDFSTGRRENLTGVREDVQLIEGSVTDLETIREASKSCEVVFHLAALPSVALSVENPTRTHAVNVTGTVHVLEAAREVGARRVVFASSCAIYGETERLPISEETPPQPLSPYALHKYVSELYIRSYIELYGLDAVILRYFNVYGPNQDPASNYAAVIPRFLRAVAKGEPPRVYGDGAQSRDFVYVRDVVEACLAAARAPRHVSGEQFNVGRGVPVTILELLDTVVRVLGREGVYPKHEPARPGDLRQSVADVRRAGERLGWHARTPLEPGLAETARAFAERTAS
jgi:UDP-glucose 4-epimerase